MEDPPDNGGDGPSREQLRDADLPRRKDTSHPGRPPYVNTRRFEELAEKISKGDRAIYNSLLRRWGIR